MLGIMGFTCRTFPALWHFAAGDKLEKQTRVQSHGGTMTKTGQGSVQHVLMHTAGHSTAWHSQAQQGKGGQGMAGHGRA